MLIYMFVITNESKKQLQEFLSKSSINCILKKF